MSTQTRTRLAFDAGEADTSMLMKDDGSPVADSAKAHRILSGCVANLSSDDMMTVAEMLKDKGLLDAGELDELKAAMAGGSGGGDDPKAAADAAMRRPRQRAELTPLDPKQFPHAGRLK